jgi:hypothetical protein
METKMLPPECQIHCLEQMSEPLGRVEIVWQLRNRIKRIIKRRLTYILNWFSEVAGSRGVASTLGVNAAASGLQAGDQVRVKSRAEIQATLNRWNRLKGCDFMEEMWAYCGTSQRVLKRVEKFLDERTYRIKRCQGIVILEKVMCGGTRDLGACDRCCFFFWREEWLEKID